MTILSIGPKPALESESAIIMGRALTSAVVDLRLKQTALEYRCDGGRYRVTSHT